MRLRSSLPPGFQSSSRGAQRDSRTDDRPPGKFPFFIDPHLRRYSRLIVPSSPGPYDFSLAAESSHWLQCPNMAESDWLLPMALSAGAKATLKDGSGVSVALIF